MLPVICTCPTTSAGHHVCFSTLMQKTKPTEHSVRELRALGLTRHLLACRSAQVSLFNSLTASIYHNGKMWLEIAEYLPV